MKIEPITQDPEFEIQRNMQATSILLGSLCQEEFDKVDGMDSTRQIWDTLQLSHEGTKEVCEGRIHALEGELNQFIIREKWTDRDVVDKIVNKIRALGGKKWTDRDVVDKILVAYMARDVNLPTLIRENRGFKRFTPADVIGRIELQLITVNEAKLTQEISKLHEQLEKNNGVALKASQMNNGKITLGSTSSKMKESDSDDDDDDDMPLFIKRFNKVMKKNGYFNKNKKRGNIKRKSNYPCFGCGQIGHFIAYCPNPKNKNKSEKKDKTHGGSSSRH